MRIGTPEFSTAVSVTVGTLAYLLAEAGDVALMTLAGRKAEDSDADRLAYIDATYKAFKEGFSGVRVGKMQCKLPADIPDEVESWDDVFNVLVNPIVTSKKTGIASERLNKTKAKFLVFRADDAAEAIEAFGITEAQRKASNWDANVTEDGAISFMAVQAL